LIPFDRNLAAKLQQLVLPLLFHPTQVRLEVLMHYAVRAILLLLLCATTAMATTVTLNMNEVPNQPIHLLTVTKSGVSFTFTEATGSLFFNSFGPGSLTFVQDPSIQGPLRNFSVAFSEPVNFIQFGLAESSLTPLLGASVTLSNGNTLPFNLALTDPFAEGQFTYSGVPVTGFSLTPAPGGVFMAFDNLTVNTLTVPEPASFALIVAGMLPAIVFAWSRRRTVQPIRRN
jgi:hypothetical protein